MVPSTYEAGKLYNVLPSGNRAPDNKGGAGYDQTRADFTFDRGSNAAATRIDENGVLQKYRENFLTYSNNLNGSDWSSTRLFSQTNGHSGYDGSNDAWLVIPNSSNNTHYVNQVITSGNGVQTISVYAKAGGYDYFSIRDNSASDTYGRFDLATQTTSTDGSNAIESKMVSVGNDWYRCSLTLNRTAGSSNNLLFYVNNVYSNKPVYVGDEVSGVYFQDFQLESSMVSTDYLDSGATTAKAGVLIDLPRINYDANGENGSLLLEPSRQQLLQYSEYFGGWTQLNITTTDNSTTSPEGLQNAAKLVASSGNSNKVIFQVITANTYTASVFAKKGEFEGLVIATGTVGAFFNLNTNSYRADYQSAPTSYDIEDYGNGWHRYSITFTQSGSNNLYIGPNDNVSTSLAITGDGTSGIYIFGAQLELGSYATSYIPNHGTSGGVTRAADSCSVTGVSDVIGQTEGTIYGEFIRTKTNDTYSPVIVLMENSTSELIEIYAGPNSNSFGVVIIDGGVNQFSKSFTAQEGINKFALAYKQNDCALYHNGVQIGTDTSATIPTLTQMTLGRFTYTSNFQLGDSIKQAALFNERLTNEELATLTTL